MSSYVKPQVLVFQEFTIVPTEITEPLRAHISGGNAVLHRYAVAAEKKDIGIGSYDPAVDLTVLWPERSPGGIIDKAYVKLYADDALLKYYTADAGNSIASVVTGSRNKIHLNGIGLVSNGEYPRESVFKDRDVKVGDVARIRCANPDDDCAEIVHTSTITGFVAETVSSSVALPTGDDANQTTASASTSSPDSSGSIPALQVYGVKNQVHISEVDGTGYAGSEDGQVSETYTIDVIAGGDPDPVNSGGCSPVRLRVRSASGTDDVLSLEAADFGSSIAIGTRGLTVKFADANSVDGLDDQGQLFVVGQKWSVTVTQAFTAPSADLIKADDTVAAEPVADLYTGKYNDVYIVEVVRGGLTSGNGAAGYPQVSVRTAKGLDFSGPHDVVDDGTGTASRIFDIGTNGLALRFDGTELSKGDKYYVAVSGTSTGNIETITLRDDVPQVAIDAGYVSVDLCIRDDIEISRPRVGYAPEVNWYMTDQEITVKEAVLAYHPTWTDGGVEQSLPVVAADLFVEYREWLADLADEVNAIKSVGEIDAIPGQLDPDNPLKWGVYKALANSNGTAVKYTAIAKPDLFDDEGRILMTNLDSWQDALERLRGRDDFYNLVPLTFDTKVHNLWAAQATAESDEYANNWKGAVVSLKSEPHVQVGGTGALVGGILGTEITDDVLATISENVGTSSVTDYTLVNVTTGNGHFIDNDVRPGDILRVNFTVDGFGDVSYEEYVIDTVESQSSLRLMSGPLAAVTQASKIEIWHNRNRNEVADAVAQQAGAFGNRRVVAVWPDQVGEGGTLMAGYYLAAAIAGLASGVVPHQPLTNVEVAGFDDFTRSYAYFNETQLNRLAEAGTWIVTEDRDGTPHTRHGLTTDNTDLNRREEMIRRNVDSISYLFYRRLKPYIGRANAQPGMLRVLGYETRAIITYLKGNGYTNELGGQLTDATIRTLQIHPLLKDRIELVIDLVVPAPLNNIELHLVI